jgi:hypothetical protein
VAILDFQTMARIPIGVPASYPLHACDRYPEACLASNADVHLKVVQRTSFLSVRLDGCLGRGQGRSAGKGFMWNGCCTRTSRSIERILPLRQISHNTHYESTPLWDMR